MNPETPFDIPVGLGLVVLGVLEVLEIGARGELNADEGKPPKVPACTGLGGWSACWMNEEVPAPFAPRLSGLFSNGFGVICGGFGDVGWGGCGFS